MYNVQCTCKPPFARFFHSNSTLPILSFGCLVMLYASAISFKYNYNTYQLQFQFSYSVFRMPYIRRECLDLAFDVQLCESYSVTSSELNLFTIHNNRTVKSHCSLYNCTSLRYHQIGKNDVANASSPRFNHLIFGFYSFFDGKKN